MRLADAADVGGVAGPGRALRFAAGARDADGSGAWATAAAAWAAGIGLGTVTVAASLVAGLLGPVAIAVYAAVLSLPVWMAWWCLARWG